MICHHLETEGGREVEKGERKEESFEILKKKLLVKSRSHHSVYNICPGAYDLHEGHCVFYNDMISERSLRRSIFNFKQQQLIYSIVGSIPQNYS